MTGKQQLKVTHKPLFRDATIEIISPGGMEVQFFFHGKCIPPFQ